MPRHANGVSALVCVNESWVPEYLDRTHVRKDPNEPLSLLNFIRGKAGVPFYINVYARPGIDYEFQSLSFLLLLDGRPSLFKNIAIGDLQDDTGLEILEQLDLRYGQKPADAEDLVFNSYNTKGYGTIELLLFRTEKVGRASALNKKDLAIFYPGQLVRDYKSKEPLGTGNHQVIEHNLEWTKRAVNFLDPLHQPWFQFVWRYTSKDFLTASLLLPRQPAAPKYKILSSPLRFPPTDLDTPISGDNLIHGLDLCVQDNLAFELLNTIKPGDLDLLTAKKKACRLLRVPNLDRYTEDQIREFAGEQLVIEVKAKVHKIALSIIWCLDMPNDVDYAQAAIKSTQIGPISLERLEKNFATLESPKQVATHLDLDQLRVKCHRHVPNWHWSKSKYSELTTWTEFRIKDETYHKAHVQAVRLLAEKRLRQIKADEEDDDDRVVVGAGGKRRGGSWELPLRKKERLE